MQSWSRFWQHLVSRSMRQAWGLASDGQDWALVGLSLQKAAGVRVHALEKIALIEPDLTGAGFSHGLKQVNVRSRRRISLALDVDEVLTGVLELPAPMAPEDWAIEVQVEVAQLLGLEPDQVNFDFQVDPASEGLLSRVYWVGCDQDRIRALKDSVHMAGWRLDSVEPAWHAAHRAVCHLQGGLASLLTQPAQDWQFDLKPPHLSKDPLDAWLWTRMGPDPALTQVMQSAVGPRLVAAGLALKAWLK